MKKPTIIALVGDSGSGKTSLSLYLQENVGIPAICSYTTRPMREGELNGREHIFVNEFTETSEGKLAYTFFGGHHYWTEHDQVANLDKCTYVIDEWGLYGLKKRWSDKYNIISVYIHRPDRSDISLERKMRDANRLLISPEEYDAIIINDSTIKDFYKQAIIQLTDLLQ